MAISFNANTEYALWNTSAATMPANANHTVAFWWRLDSDLNTLNHVLTITSDGSATTYWSVITDTDGTTLRLGKTAGGGTNGSALSVGTWYHICVVKNGTSFTVYLNGVSNITDTITINSYVDGCGFVFGGNTVDTTDNSAAHLKVWNTNLSASDVAQEYRIGRPATNQSNLWGHFPFFTNVGTDFSGQAHGLTIGGSPVTVDGPPVSWGGRVVTILPVGVAPQYGRPISDTTTGWSTSTGTDHYALLDEVSPSDSDYVYATSASLTDKVRLTSLTDPVSAVSHIVRYRIPTLTGGAKVVVKLYEGTTLIATDTTRTAAGDYQMTLSESQANSITDYTALYVQLESTS